MVILNLSDTRELVAPLMSVLPAAIQNLNAQITNMQRQGRAVTPIKLDQNKVPRADELRSRLFPSSFAVAVDARGIKITSREALPSVYSPMASGVLAALLLPATQSAREAARRSQCVNNLKQIALAMHNYHAANNAFPKQAFTDKDGKPLLSWRVALLPYLDQQDLYNKFHLDEPWDSEHNKALIKEMPPLFACPTRANLAPGATVYCGFVGNGALWDKDQGTSLQQITDGTSNTIAVVEAKDGVIWTKPEDLSFDPEKGKFPFGAGSDHPGGFNAAFADGAVHFIKMSINADVLKALITRAGGEVVGADSF
jgi:prepilin-type processing-associated H-X9-DG protein